MTTEKVPLASDRSRVAPQLLLRAFEHRHELVHLLYSADDEADALHRIGRLLEIDEATAASIVEHPLRDLLPENRAGLGEPR
jgi:hypothetical protein